MSRFTQGSYQVLLLEKRQHSHHEPSRNSVLSDDRMQCIQCTILIVSERRVFLGGILRIYDIYLTIVESIRIILNSFKFSSMIAHLIILNFHLNLAHVIWMTLNLLMNFILVSIFITDLSNNCMTFLMIANRNLITVFLGKKFQILRVSKVRTV